MRWLFVWVKFYVPSPRLAVLAIWDVYNSRSMRVWCHIPCKPHPDQPKTQVGWSSGLCSLFTEKKRILYCLSRESKFFFQWTYNSHESSRLGLSPRLTSCVLFVSLVFDDYTCVKHPGHTGILRGNKVYTIKCLYSKEKCVLCRKYSRQVHKTATIVFNVRSTISRTIFHLSSAMFSRVSIFVYVIYSSADAQCKQCASAEE